VDKRNAPSILNEDGASVPIQPTGRTRESLHQTTSAIPAGHPHHRWPAPPENRRRSARRRDADRGTHDASGGTKRRRHSCAAHEGAGRGPRRRSLAQAEGRSGALGNRRQRQHQGAAVAPPEEAATVPGSRFPTAPPPYPLIGLSQAAASGRPTTRRPSQGTEPPVLHSIFFSSYDLHGNSNK
jgi:hypothetical protein